MTDVNREKFAKWIDELVKHCLPLELEVKLLTNQPLTREEAERFVGVINLVAQAQAMHGDTEIMAKLDNLRRGVAKCHRNEREILWCVSEEKERFENDDGRKLDSIKEAAVYLACTRIRSAPQDDQNAIANKVFNDFKTLPGFYSDFHTFMRQVYRSLKRFAT